MNNPWLSITPPEANLNTIRVDGDSSVDAFWAVDPTGDFLFLVEGLQPDPRVSIPAIDAIQSAVVPNGNSVRLFLKLQDQVDWELFYSLCMDLVRALRGVGPERGLATVAARLAKWKEFLRSAQGRSLSEERIRGLLAELLFLEKRLAPRLGWDSAVSAWTGPLGTPQDFSVGSKAVEVKAKLNSTRRKVRISSAAQLDSRAGALFLLVTTFGVGNEEDEDSDSLADAVSRIRKIVAGSTEMSERFEDRLLAAGYADATIYERTLLVPEKEETFRVVDGFPRIIPGMLPSGVLAVEYDIDLNACASFAASDNWLDC